MKKKIFLTKDTLSPFDVYKNTLNAEDLSKIVIFFSSFKRHCTLSKKQFYLLREDFEKALLYYASVSVPLDTALVLLDTEKLGGFYVRPPVSWYMPDDAAKIYPISMKHGQMAMFRISFYLVDRIVPELLQMALNFTIKRFPSFAVTVKKGFFWHYLDSTKRRYKACLERDVPCRPLNVSNTASQSFRVLYYQKRISVEFFHMITDGTGGLNFLKTLTAEYLHLLGVKSDDEGIMKRSEIPTLEEAANEFYRTEASEKSGGFVDSAAKQMSGKLSKVKPCQVLHFRMDANELKQVAKARGATITAYILSKMFLAGKFATDETNGTINIQVPVNMRKFYPSKTVRNFSLYCGIRLPIAQIEDDTELTSAISEQLKIKASREAMSAMMKSTKKMVSALRYIPLCIKSPVAKIVYGFMGDVIFSNTLSNLGVVNMPKEYDPYIEKMDFVLGTAVTNRAGCSMITFNNTATLSIAKMTTDPSFEEELFRLLIKDGINPKVEGSPLYEN